MGQGTFGGADVLAAGGAYGGASASGKKHRVIGWSKAHENKTALKETTWFKNKQSFSCDARGPMACALKFARYYMKTEKKGGFVVVANEKGKIFIYKIDTVKMDEPRTFTTKSDKEITVQKETKAKAVTTADYKPLLKKALPGKTKVIVQDNGAIYLDE